ncbi:TetR/AcrR family transcriptional regulator [Celerinatantimonas sp. YJH-8]|uniref:TetR/AcrR family transcriptional regulator n=1 Tax=Celerinatantimonas sp. YJH-8 TaxID=3228714 RepID=UPI0038C31BC7
MAKTRSEQKRKAILHAALSAFREDGAQQTSMDKIAELANVSKRTIYNHFPSKEALIASLLAELWQNIAHLVVPEQLASLDWNEQLEQLLYSEIELLSSPEYIDLARVVMGHYLFRPQDLAEISQQKLAQQTQLSIWLEEQVNQQTLMITNVEEATAQLHSLVKGQCFWPQILGFKPMLTACQKNTLAQKTAAFFLNNYRRHLP